MTSAAPAEAVKTMRTTCQVPPEELTDGTVTLSKYRAEYAEAMYAAVKSTLPELIRWMTWATEAYSLEEAQGFTAFSQKSWDEGSSYDYVILVDGVPSGSFSLMTRADHDAIEIGYWLRNSVTGKGLATRAASLLTKTAFEIGGNDVRIRTDVENVKSAAVPQRLGFTKLGTQPMVIKGKESLHTMWQMKRPSEEKS